MSTDTNRLDVICGYLHYLWSGPLQVVAIMALLVNLLGASAWSGFGFLVLLFPVQGFLMGWLAKIRKRNSSITDQRVRLTQEILNGIRVIKFYAWESSFLKRLSDLRDKEISLIRMLSYARAAVNAIITSVPIFSGVITFVVYAALGNDLKAEIIFPALTLINLLRLPMILFPMIVTQYVDGKVAVGRIQSFLLGEESTFKPEINQESKFAVEAKDAKFVWKTLPKEEEDGDGKGKGKEKEKGKEDDIELESKEEKHPFELDKFSLEIERGKLIAIVGAVGSGKSSLLSALLGEMSYEEGKVSFCGSVGYCPQQAW